MRLAELSVSVDVLRQLVGLPDDTKIVAAYYDRYNETVDLVISHPLFPDCDVRVDVPKVTLSVTHVSARQETCLKVGDTEIKSERIL